MMEFGFESDGSDYAALLLRERVNFFGDFYI
jgi:hypothetical protein